MRLNAKLIKNVANVNLWEYTNERFIQDGQANTIYIQLVDLDKIQPAEKSKANPDFPLRYISQATVIEVEMTFPDLDSVEEFTVQGTQPFADDKSIWRFDLTSDQTPNSGGVIVKITEDGEEKSFVLRNAINVEYNDIGGC